MLPLPSRARGCGGQVQWGMQDTGERQGSPRVGDPPCRPAVWPLPALRSSLCFDFLICQMGRKAPLQSSQRQPNQTVLRNVWGNVSGWTRQAEGVMVVTANYPCSLGGWPSICFSPWPSQEAPGAQAYRQSEGKVPAGHPRSGIMCLLGRCFLHPGCNPVGNRCPRLFFPREEVFPLSRNPKTCKAPACSRHKQGLVSWSGRGLVPLCAHTCKPDVLRDTQDGQG